MLLNDCFSRCQKSSKLILPSVRTLWHKPRKYSSNNEPKSSHDDQRNSTCSHFLRLFCLKWNGMEVSKFTSELGKLFCYNRLTGTVTGFRGAVLNKDRLDQRDTSILNLERYIILIFRFLLNSFSLIKSFNESIELRKQPYRVYFIRLF